MRAYNADPAHGKKLQFYGFDSPTEMMWSDSPRRLVEFVLDYLDQRECRRRGAAGANCGAARGRRTVGEPGSRV